MIVGIDPGNDCGIAIANRNGTIAYFAQADLRYLEGWQQLCAALSMFEKDTYRVLGIEKSWLGPNARSALDLSVQIGRIIQAADERGFEHHLISPAEWRVSAGIQQGARSPLRAVAKKRAIDTARRYLQKESQAAHLSDYVPRPQKLSDHEAEAICIAVYTAGMQRMGWPEKKAPSQHARRKKVSAA